MQTELNPATRIECSKEEYNEIPAVRQSDLKQFISDPELFKAKRDGVFSEGKKKHFEYGNNLEDLVLYGKLPGVLVPEEVMQKRTLKTGESYARAGKKYDAWLKVQKETYGDDILPMTQDEWSNSVAPLLLARDKLREHELANKLLWGEGQVHVVLTWKDELTNLDCKCELDAICGPKDDPVAIADLKTAANVDKRRFESAAYDFGYHIQAWWYREAVYRWCGKRLPFVFVVSRSSGARNCATYTLSDDWYDLAEQTIVQGMADYARALERDEWLPEDHGKLITLEPPRWAR